MTQPTPTSQWDRIAHSEDFAAILRAKRRFLIPATIFFLVYYLALPILVGWFPETMNKSAWGKVNWAYLFALSQFFMAWILAAMYVVVAARWDKMTAAVLAKHGHGPK